MPLATLHDITRIEEHFQYIAEQCVEVLHAEGNDTIMGTRTKSKTTKKQTVSGRVDVRVEPLNVELKRENARHQFKYTRKLQMGF